MKELLAHQKTLMLSTLTPESTPSISYAPYIMRASDIYIYISQTAEHYHTSKDVNVKYIDTRKYTID